MVVDRVANHGENISDGVEGEWHVCRVAGKTQYVCDFGVCAQYGTSRFVERSRLNSHRRLHDLPEVADRRKGRKQTDKLSYWSSEYRREAYKRQKQDETKVLKSQYRSKRSRTIAKWCQLEKVESKEGLSKAALLAIEKEMEEYDSEQNKQKRIEDHRRLEAIKSCKQVGIDHAVPLQSCQPKISSSFIGTNIEVALHSQQQEGIEEQEEEINEQNPLEVEEFANEQNETKEQQKEQETNEEIQAGKEADDVENTIEKQEEEEKNEQICVEIKDDDQKQNEKEQVYLPDRENKIKGLGNGHNIDPNGTCHNAMIGYGHVSVRVERSFDDAFQLPIPRESVSSMGEAVRSIVIWPTMLLEQVEKRVISKGPASVASIGITTPVEIKKDAKRRKMWRSLRSVAQTRQRM